VAAEAVVLASALGGGGNGFVLSRVGDAYEFDVMLDDRAAATKRGSLADARSWVHVGNGPCVHHPLWARFRDRALAALRVQRAAPALACVTDVQESGWQKEIDAGKTFRFATRTKSGRCVDIVDGGYSDSGVPLSTADAQEAWETMAARDAIPHDWVQSEWRGFGTTTYRVAELPREGKEGAFFVVRDDAGTADVDPIIITHTGALVGSIVTKYGAASFVRTADGLWKKMIGSLAASSGPVDLAVRAYPPSAEACVALAADVPGVLQAEELGRACAAAVDSRARKIVWVVRRVAVGEWQTGAVPKWMSDRIHARGLGEALVEAGYCLAGIDDERVMLVCQALEGT